PGPSGDSTPRRTTTASERTGAAAHPQIVSDRYGGAWVPAPADVQELTFDGDRSESLRRSGFHNSATGTTVVTAGLRKGDTYVVDAVFPKTPTDEQLGDTPIAKMKLPEPQHLPEELSTLAAETVVDAETPIAQVRALETYLSKSGFFSHGLGSQAHL